jgi:tRNA uridine 5-carboxymethylaminomethyl modification enzyme
MSNLNSQRNYQVIVVGAGHAGCEAALAAARMGLPTLLITLNLGAIARMSCNPAIGGIAKGQIVREIDVLGGEMAKNTDKAGIHYRMLNLSKGPAMHSPRVQCDQRRYLEAMTLTLRQQANLDLLEGEVTELLIERDKADVFSPDGHRGDFQLKLCIGDRQGTQDALRPEAEFGMPMPHRHTSIAGVKLKSGESFSAGAVILTTGTFLNGLLHRGTAMWPGGRRDESPATGLSDNLRDLGFEVLRLKTGTPPRIHKDSINYDALEIQKGDNPPQPISHFTPAATLPQIDCWLTYTNPATHAIIRNNLDRAPLYTGQIQSAGPRYCPSIEDKIMRFAGKERHQIFLELESLSGAEVYCNGISTSLPEDVQEAMVHSNAGLEQARIIHYGYAVEYDYCPPTQLQATLETKNIQGLYFAGQLNGTTGYEEAAAQGLLAGINAARAIQNQPPLILGRDEAYIGVLIDDLVTKGILDPYRMFTCRAEYRLLLRNDNADLRLLRYGAELGLIPKESYALFERYRYAISERIALLESVYLPRNQASTTLALLLRQGHSYEEMSRIYGKALPELTLEPDFPWNEAKLRRQVEIEITYQGFLDRQREEVAAFAKMEARKIPGHFDYDRVPGLLTESRLKLKQVKPLTLGQASRISGVTPADLNILLVWLKKIGGNLPSS